MLRLTGPERKISVYCILSIPSTSIFQPEFHISSAQWPVDYLEAHKILAVLPAVTADIRSESTARDKKRPPLRNAMLGILKFLKTLRLQSHICLVTKPRGS